MAATKTAPKAKAAPKEAAVAPAPAPVEEVPCTVCGAITDNATDGVCLACRS